jgi:hypothetical protein
MNICKKKVFMNFLTIHITERKSILRWTDVMVYEWIYKHACEELTQVLPLMGLGLRIQTFTVDR